MKEKFVIKNDGRWGRFLELLYLPSKTIQLQYR